MNKTSTHQLSTLTACSAVLFVGLLLVANTGCSEYNKIMKSTDLDYKYERALGFLDSNKCYGALPILEEVVSLTRGTERSVDAQYNFAKAQRCVGDYYLARYYFKMFAKTFPHDPRAQEAQFESAVCSYLLSPKPSLDQLETEQAIEEFQLFLDRYPASAFRDSSQTMVDELRHKLEVKSFEGAYNYYHTENYKSAVIAFENALKEYPDTPYREQMQWLIVDSYFRYAQLSTERRKLERYNDTIEAFLTFVARYPESQYMAQAQNVHDKSVKAIDNLAANRPIE